MKVITRKRELSLLLEEERIQRKSVGFVPTMGALHEGHLSLVHASTEDNDITVVSIFVNPTQFGEGEDFSKYPKSLETDQKLLEEAGVDFLFLPTAEEMYGPDALTYIDMDHLPKHLCGKNRPGHFRGVMTVVGKLFHIVRPHRAYFGQKDYQQSVIIKQMAEDLDFFTDIRVCPIVREADGLAMSSRNRYLNERQRKDATILYRALDFMEYKIRNRARIADKLTFETEEFIKRAVPYAELDYISIVDPKTLELVRRIENKVVLLLAVKIGPARLIDNRIIKVD